MKNILILLLMTLSLKASEVAWVHSYSEGMAKAQQTHKSVLVFMNSPLCGSCAYMKENVFTDEKVVEYLKTNYVAISLDIHKNDAPQHLQVKVTPVFYFLNANGEANRETLMGGKTAPFFLKLLKQSDKK